MLANEEVYVVTTYSDCDGDAIVKVSVFKTKEAAKKEFIKLLDDALDGEDAEEILGCTYDECVSDLSFNSFGTYKADVRKVIVRD